MNTAPTPPAAPELPAKIARLVEERGWNQDDFARVARLNRHTVRQILHDNGTRKLRNATVSQIATALGLTVSELRTLPLERLLPRMRGLPADDGDAALRDLYATARQPELLAWLERNAERAKRFTADELRELLDLQGEGGPIARFGVDHFVEMIERRRGLVERVKAVAATEYLGFLEQFVGLLYDKVRPPEGR